MHIKQITISNFRSFKQQPEIQPFSPGTNSVVGRNGSGKSNLFDAVQFVLLSPRFYNLRAEERQALLHEGSGSAAMNAFVEIVFDNSDHRFSLENSDEVVLRRTVGNKKDEFFLQRKRTTKTEITSLLEGAGFSKSNPYFMVQQGKIQDICTMSDRERLNLLKSVAGTVVYDEKKLESLNKMEENSSSVQKIQQILSDIENRLNELQEEKDELANYQKCDRTRRAMEYTLYDKELNKARNLLDHIQHMRQEHLVQDLSKLHEKAKDTHLKIRNVETILKTKTNTLRRNKISLQAYQDDFTLAMKEQMKLQLQTQEIKEAIALAHKQKQLNEKQLAKLQKDIDKAEQQLHNKVLPKYNEENNKLQQMIIEKNQAKHKMDSLHAKQGRTTEQFDTKEQRDEYIQGSIDDLLSVKKEKESLCKQQKGILASLLNTVSEDETTMTQIENELTEKQKTLQSMMSSIDEKKHTRIDVIEQRKEYYRSNEQYNELVREAREHYKNSIFDIRKSMPKATSMGIEALTSIVQKEQLILGTQYFGMVIDNMKLKDSKFTAAVEVALQNSLFHVIVDTDHTAARLMKRLEDGKLGRVTFLPLNQLSSFDDTDQSSYNDSQTIYSQTTNTVTSASYNIHKNNNDVQSMLDVCVEYDPKVSAAMKHVFHKKLLGRTTEIASEYSTKYNMDVITLDGDLCSRKGALTGGYIDTSQSRIRAYNRRMEAQKELAEAQKKQAETKDKVHHIEQTLANLKHEIERLEMKSKDLKRALSDKRKDLNSLKKKVETSKKQAEKMDKTSIPPLQEEIKTIANDISKLKEEMGTELVSSLSNEDRALLKQLKQVQVDLSDKIEIQNEKALKFDLERQKLQSLLEDNLLKRKQELEATIAAGAAADVVDDNGAGMLESQRQQEHDLEVKERELENATRLKDEIDTKLKEAQKIDEDLRAELHSAKNEIEKLKSEDIKNAKALQEAQDKSERMLTKRSMCISKRETYMRKIQELGSLPPPSELQEFSNLSVNDLMKGLEGINKKLKKYSHVNKKAYDQYVNFSEQRENLLKRKKELDLGAEKIESLIENLDKQKDEAINRTFRGVSSHFKDVFKELVPNGHGELMMRTALDEAAATAPTDNEETSSSSDSDDDSKQQKKSAAVMTKKAFDPNNPDVSLYRGIGIKVRFSKVGENYLMSQLSGGQKALVALALIFAIQRCDPAPFYLFDELDQALDSTYRQAVANLIQRQANHAEEPTQFIVSTFRPELVAVANRCYGISHQNKVSSIHPLSKKDALHFIANLMLNEEDTNTGTETKTRSASKSRSSRSSTRSSTRSSARKRKAIEDAKVEDETEEKMDNGVAVEAQ